MGWSNRRRGMGWGMQESSWHLQMLWVQWNMGAIFQHVWGNTCTRRDTNTHTQACCHLPHTKSTQFSGSTLSSVCSSQVHLCECVCLCMSVCVCVRGGLHGWVCVHLWHQLDRHLIASMMAPPSFADGGTHIIRDSNVVVDVQVWCCFCSSTWNLLINPNPNNNSDWPLCLGITE